jgi:hypothetical protein
MTNHDKVRKRIEWMRERYPTDRRLELAQAAEAEMARECANCRELVPDGHGWIRLYKVGPSDDDEVEGDRYCDRCVTLDESRRFRGRPAPPMERIER